MFRLPFWPALELLKFRGKMQLFLVTFSLLTLTLSFSIAAPPPSTWQEHWKEHRQELTKVFQDSDLAVYFDDDVDRSIKWPNTYLSQVWRYVKKTYGSFGPESELYVVFHTGKYPGGHPSNYFVASHDNHNVIDVGQPSREAWKKGQGRDIDVVTHEVAHIVEDASKGIHKSPAFPIWRDSKWAEIFQLDVYEALGRTEDVQRWDGLMMNNKDDFPRENTYWYRDWFKPIYYNYGRSAVLNRFFTLLAENFPKQRGNPKQYARSMVRDKKNNMGEFVHFWSGAANKNLKSQATKAFGWNDDYENQLVAAQKDFPNVKYLN